MAAWYQLKQDEGFPTPGVGMPPDLTVPHDIVYAVNSSFRQTLFEGAVEGHVLVKNEKGALPLKSPRMISLFGYSAKSPDIFNPPSNGWNGGSSSVSANDSITIGGTTIHSQIASNGTLISGGGSGANEPAYISSPFEAPSQRAYEDGTHLWWDFHSSSPRVDQASDACIVLVNAFASEGWDRPGLHATSQTA
jgi:beta-glucosidase